MTVQLPDSLNCSSTLESKSFTAQTYVKSDLAQFKRGKDAEMVQ